MFVFNSYYTIARAVYNQDMITVETCENSVQWDEEVLALGGHPLQLWGWGEVKCTHNWRVERVFVRENHEIIGVAQLLIRVLPWPFRSLVYVPRGPVAEERNREEVLTSLADYAKREHGAVAITVEPDWTAMPGVERWVMSDNTILIPRTLILDLSKTEEELLSDMTKKTRQYIRKSGSESIELRQVKGREELDGCLALYKETAERAHFAIHDDEYYYDIFEMLGEHSPVFAAFYEKKPIAFLWLAISSETAFELYGGMNDEGQRLRANYALKWHAIQTMKKWGLIRYDFNGLLNDGVSTFKQGFSSHEDMLVGTYDKPLSPLYTVWSKGLPFAKKVVRKLKNR
jgi:lipid II:glycine glycyltransferase (peptidoglycan interpeptide bridge formation enzyme)